MQMQTQTRANATYDFLEPNIHGVIARLDSGQGEGTYADVVCLTRHDVVVSSTASIANFPKRGDVVSVSLLRNDAVDIPQSQEAVVHWHHTIGDRQLVGMFLKEPAGAELMDRVWDDRRSQLRFPTALSVNVHDEGEIVEGRISNYSLDGLALHTEDHLSTGVEYLLTVPCESGALDLHAVCQWSIETSYGYISGCSLREGEGVMLAVGDIVQPALPWELSHSKGTGLEGDRTPAEANLLATHARYNARLELEPEPEQKQKSPVLEFALLPALALTVAMIFVAVSAKGDLITVAGVIALAAIANGYLSWREAARARDQAKASSRSRLNERVNRTCAPQ